MKPGSTSLRTRPTSQQRELLSFTNAAVQSLCNRTQEDKPRNSTKSTSEKIAQIHQNGSSSDLFLSTSDENVCETALETSTSSDRHAVLKLGTNLSSSSGSSSCKDAERIDLSLDSSFNTSTAVRVRVPSRLLKEIKPPLNRSLQEGDISITDSQPAAKIVRHINGPSAWVSLPTNSPLHIPEHSVSIHREPTSTTTVYTHEVLQANDVDKLNEPSQSTNTQSSKHLNRPIYKHEEMDEVKASLDLKKTHNTVGLSQGDRVTGLLMGSASQPDSVKTMSFSLSQRERLLKDEFLKRQDRKSAPIKRSVQPTIIPPKQVQNPDKDEAKAIERPLENQVASAAAIAAAAASAATAPFLQVDARLRKLEELQQQLLSTQETQINKRLANPFSGLSSGIGQVEIQHHPSIRIASQSQTLSHTQGLISQHTSQPQSTSSHQSFSNPSFIHQTLQDQPVAPQPSQILYHPPQTTQGLSRPYVLQTEISSHHAQSSDVSQQAITHHPIQATNPSSHTSPKIKMSQGIAERQQMATQATQTASRSYVPAKQLPLHETVAMKPVKNTKSQTSPQDSSLSSSDSPLQTPLPRKKPPRPMPHSSAKKIQHHDLPRRQKRVHFDSVDDPLLSFSRYTPMDYSEQTRFEKAGPIHQVTTAPSMPQQRSAIQSRDKVIAASGKGVEQVMDELSRMRSDIRTVLTETERMKRGLYHQKISHELDTRFSHNDKGPSLLDVYLTKKVPKAPSEPVKPYKRNAPVATDHCADIKQILRDVETQRNNLEHNLDAIVRHNEEENLYAIVDSMIQGAQGAELSRVRQNVDKMIKDMSEAIKKEIAIEGQKSEIKSKTPVKVDSKETKFKGKYQPGRKVPGKQSTFTGRQARPGKENALPYNNKDKKQKMTNPVSTSKTSSKPASKPVSKPVSTTTNQTYLKSIYGRQPHHTHRTTSKAPYLHYQSPVNPRTAALTAAILGTGSQHPTQPAKPMQDKKDEARREPWYYLHPAVDRSQVIPAGDGKVHVHAPLEGKKMPMAIPLGKPRTDPSLRLPLPSTAPFIEPAKEASPVQPTQSTPIQPSPKPSPTKPNVAVITVQHEGLEEDISKKKKKTGKSDKRQPKLAVQVLPQMDVDSLTESSEATPRYESYVWDESKPVTRPADIEYEDFRNYLAVKDTTTEQEDLEDDETPRIPTPENPLTIQGHAEKDRLYHGPPFPPENPPLPTNTTSCVLDTDKRVSDALEDRALEWVEQELLARMVSEMNQPLPDPTLVAKPPESSPESSLVSDDGEVLAATIGLGGLQLFVDAGIPVDRNLVAELIKDVIAEQIASTLGYPKPTATSKEPQVDIQLSPQTPEQAATPVTTPVPTPVYTPVESESSAAPSSKVSTPERTPTPSEFSVTMEMDEDPTPTKEVQEEKVETEPEVTEARSPVQTPVATPTGSQSPTASVSTPEPSTREPDSIDNVIPMDTPEPSVSIPSPKSTTVSTPTPAKPTETPSPPTPPPEPPTPVKPSPPSITTSTLSPGTTSTMTTFNEELSEGQLIQPYVHGGKYSEGEYAISPGLVDLVKERNIPVDTEDVLGKDEDSRNELIRIALNGLLRRGLYSSSNLNTTSNTSTLRDADDIRQDSLDEYSHSEGEVIFPRDPVPVRYAGASQHPRAKSSPGELTPNALRSNRLSSPGEINTSPGARRTHPNTPNGHVIKVTPGSAGQQQRQTPNTSRDNSDSRSLHKSDLQHGHRGQPRACSREGSPQRFPQNGRHQSFNSNSEPRPQSSDGQRPPSRGSDRSPNRGSDRQPSRGGDRSPTRDDGRPASGDTGRPHTGSHRPGFRQPIYVAIPPMEPDDSSVLSGEVPGYDVEDTSGDVSSISGGDF